jgi:hypothetical protein
MKSKLFQRFDPNDVPDKKFAQDLSLLLSLSPEQWNSIVAALTPILSARTESERKPIVEKLEVDTGLARTALGKATNLAGFFLSAFNDEDIKDEDPSLWADDLLSISLLTTDHRERFLLFVDCLKSQALDDIEVLERRRKAESGVLPAFTGASTTVELRAVFKKIYKWGTPINDYSPECEDLTPIVSVAIAADSGIAKRFTFQATPEEIEYLICELQAALKCAQVISDRK